MPSHFPRDTGGKEGFILFIHQFSEGCPDSTLTGMGGLHHLGAPSLRHWGTSKMAVCLEPAAEALRRSTPLVDQAMAPHSSPLAWEIPWADEPGRLQSMGMPRASGPGPKVKSRPNATLPGVLYPLASHNKPQLMRQSGPI